MLPLLSCHLLCTAGLPTLFLFLQLLPIWFRNRIRRLWEWLIEGETSPTRAPHTYKPNLEDCGHCWGQGEKGKSHFPHFLSAQPQLQAGMLLQWGGAGRNSAHMASLAPRCCGAARYGSTRALPRRKYQLWALAGSGSCYSEPQHCLSEWLVAEERVCLQALLQREGDDVSFRGAWCLQQLLTAKGFGFGVIWGAGRMGDAAGAPRGAWGCCIPKLWCLLSPWWCSENVTSFCWAQSLSSSSCWDPWNSLQPCFSLGAGSFPDSHQKSSFPHLVPH